MTKKHATVREITLEQFHEEAKAQGVSSRHHVAFKCPICGTVQSIHDLVAAGAGKSEEDAERFIGFSCVGRWTKAGPYPADSDKSVKAKARRAIPGCDWTLGGLFQLHRLAVITPDGNKHPTFDLATPDEAQAHESVGRQVGAA